MLFNLERSAGERCLTTACTRPPTRKFSCSGNDLGLRVMPGVRPLTPLIFPTRQLDKSSCILARQSHLTWQHGGYYVAGER